MPREVQFCTEQVSGIRGKIANSLWLGTPDSTATAAQPRSTSPGTAPPGTGWMNSMTLIQHQC